MKWLYALLLTGFAFGNVDGGLSWTSPPPVEFDIPPDRFFDASQQNPISGHAIIGYTDGTSTEISAAVYTPDPSGGSWTSAMLIDTSTLRIQNIYVSVNSLGQAAAVWAESDESTTTTIIVSTYSGGVWSAPDLVDTLTITGAPQSPSVAVGIDDLGVVRAVYSDVDNHTLFTAIKVGPTWNITQIDGPNVDVYFRLDFKVNSSGDGAAAWLISQNTDQAFAAYLTGGAFQAPQNLNSVGNLGKFSHLQVGVGSGGHAIVTWIPTGNTLLGAAKNTAADPWVTTTIINGSIVNLTAPPSVNASGNAVQGFPTTDNVSETVHAVSYSPTTGWDLGNIETITTFPTTNIGTNFPVAVSMDNFGNEVALWMFGDDTTLEFSLQAATKISGSTWSFSGAISVPDVNSFVLPFAAINPDRLGVAFWLDNNLSTANGAVTTEAFPPPPTPTPTPVNFRGKAVENKFLNATERVIELRWNSSVDPEVTRYLLYRNGKLIASLPNTTHYIDYNIRKHKEYTYNLVAVRASGQQSAPAITVVRT